MVQQQHAAPIDVRALEPEGSRAEREADAFAHDVAEGRAPRAALSASPQGIPRDPAPVLTPEQERAGELAYYQSTREARLEARARREAEVRAELRKLSPSQINARWKDDKKVFIDAASKPNHGLSAKQMLEICKHYWADRYEAGRATRMAIARREMDADPGAYITKRNRFEDGDYDALGPEFAQAVADEAVGESGLRNIVYAHELLRAAEASNKSLTLDFVTESTLLDDKYRQIVRQGFEAWGMMGRGFKPTALPARRTSSSAPPSRQPPPGPPVTARPPPAPAPKLEVVRGGGQASGTPTGMLRDVDTPGRGVEVPASHPVFKGKMPANEPPPRPQGQRMKVAVNAPKDVRTAQVIETAPPAPGQRPAPRASADKPPAGGDKPKVGRAAPAGAGERGGKVPAKVDPDVSRARQLDQLERSGKVSGDVPGLRKRLRSTDPEIQTAAQREFDEVRAKVAKGEKVDIEDYGDAPRRKTPVKEDTRISTPQKSELENSAELKKLLPDEGDRRKFMDWLKKGHREADLGPEVPEGGRQTERHEHFDPGSPALEAKVREWQSGQGPKKKK